MPGIDPISLGLEAVPAIISGISSILQSGKAKRLAKENQRPIEMIPQGVTDSVQLAKTLAMSGGLQGATEMAAKKEIARKAATAQAEATTRRAGVATAGAVQETSNEAGLQLAARDEAARTANTQNLIQQNQTLAGWQDKVWDYNNRQKYEENAAAIRALKTASQENMNTAANSLLSTGAKANAGDLNTNQLGNVKITAPKDPTMNTGLFGGGVIPAGMTSFLSQLMANQWGGTALN